MNQKFILSKHYSLRYLLSIFFFEQINEILSIISAKDMIVKKQKINPLLALEIRIPIPKIYY